jgi:hypothetical protein
MLKKLVALLAVLIVSWSGAASPCCAEYDPEMQYASEAQKLFTSEWFKQLPGAGKDLHVLFSVAPDGRYKVLGIGNEKLSQPAAKAALHRMLLSVPAFPPLIPQLNGKPYAWMAFSWDNTPRSSGHFFETSSASGPYFSEEIPNFIKYHVGLKQRSYVDCMDQKILDSWKLEGEMNGSGVVFLALDGKGVIKRISLSCSDKVYDQWLYGAIGRAQPFGELPADYKQTPYFKTQLNWQHGHGGGGGSCSTIHTKTYMGK